MTVVRRLFSFYRSHGLGATLARCAEAVRRLSYGGRTILFSCVLPTDHACRPLGLSVERTDASSLSKAEYLHVFGAQDPATRERELAARFAAGSALWLARWEGQLAGYGWTIRGSTIEPHFFPIAHDEVHFFDFFVAPALRGRGINVALMAEMLARMDDEHIRQVHLECAAWNATQLQSLNKSPFRRYAAATKLKILGRTLVIWH